MENRFLEPVIATVSAAPPEYATASKVTSSIVLLKKSLLSIVQLAMLRYAVDSKKVQYNCTTNTLLSAYDYQSTQVLTDPDGRYRVVPTSETLTFRTKCRVPRVGCMLVGWGGNNGSTVTACVLANKIKLKWRTKEGMQVQNLYCYNVICKCRHIRLLYLIAIRH